MNTWPRPSGSSYGHFRYPSKIHMHYAYNTFVFNDEPLQHKTSQLETALAVLHQQNKQRRKWQLTRSSTNTEHAHLCTVERNTRDAKPNAFNMCTYTKFIPQIPGRNAVYLTTPRTSLISVPVEWLSLSFRIPGLPGSKPSKDKVSADTEVTTSMTMAISST